MKDLLMADEGIRFDASIEKLAGLKTVTEGGVITACLLYTSPSLRDRG